MEQLEKILGYHTVMRRDLGHFLGRIVTTERAGCCSLNLISSLLRWMKVEDPQG
jgi:hypothetical protein